MSFEDDVTVKQVLLVRSLLTVVSYTRAGEHRSRLQQWRCYSLACCHICCYLSARTGEKIKDYHGVNLNRCDP